MYCTIKRWIFSKKGSVLMFKKIVFGVLLVLTTLQSQSLWAASKQPRLSYQYHFCVACAAVALCACYWFQDPLLEFGNQNVHYCNECAKPCLENCTECVQQIPVCCRTCIEAFAACSQGFGECVKQLPRCIEDCTLCCDDCAKALLPIGTGDARGIRRRY